MRAVLMALMACLASPAWSGEDILQVLHRSQQMQLTALEKLEVDPDSEEARRIRDSFERVLTVLRAPPGDVRLIVVRGPLLAVCLMGKVVAANVSIADLTESERLFVLAHEVGHIQLGHWPQFGALYKQHIPGEVVPATTDPVAGVLGREASALSHQHEYEADAFALKLLRHMGEPDDTPIVLFTEHLPAVKATATHPGTHQRLAHLRTLR